MIEIVRGCATHQLGAAPLLPADRCDGGVDPATPAAIEMVSAPGKDPARAKPRVATADAFDRAAAGRADHRWLSSGCFLSHASASASCQL